MSNLIEIRGITFNKENITYYKVKSYFQDFTEKEYNTLLGIVPKKKKEKIKLSDKSKKIDLEDKKG